MSAKRNAPGTQEDRFAAYSNSLAQAAGHLDRHEPLKAYCKGLLLPIERKSVEPMAARLAPDNVRQMHQSMHHLVADAPWDDEVLLKMVRHDVLPVMIQQSPVEAWIVDDTGFPKKGKHSVGVAHQYCGQLGKSDNCQVAVSLSVTTRHSSLPIAWQLYLPKDWAGDRKRRTKAGVPQDIEFQTKPEMALKQIQAAVRQGIATGAVLADAAYGSDSRLRKGITELGLDYVVGVQSSMSVWKPGEGPLPNKRAKAYGPDPLKGRSKDHHPVSTKQVALSLRASAWKIVKWREGSRKDLTSRFAAVRLRPAHRDYLLSEPYPEEWLLIEWPEGEPEPTKYWLSTLSEETPLKQLVRIAKHRWIIERDYQELKQELGLGHYEGRGWRGFHHHATLCIAAYGFLVAERNRFSPSARVGNVGLRVPTFSETFIPRGAVTTRTT
jgi:SRSO17 transposase